MAERPIREAAAAICVRDGPQGGPEVLVVRRSSASPFLPGYISFPGGAVEPEDGERAARWFGDAGQASRVAALRELAEEVGISITSGGVIRSGGLDPVDRDPPDRASIHEICHWVAPPLVPVRFDARFFAILVMGKADPIVDDREISHSWWTSPAAVLAGWAAGAHKLYWPTWFTFGRLASCATAEDLLALRFDTREPTDDEIAEMPPHVMEQVP